MSEFDGLVTSNTSSMLFEISKDSSSQGTFVMPERITSIEKLKILTEPKIISPQPHTITLLDRTIVPPIKGKGKEVTKEVTVTLGTGKRLKQKSWVSLK